MAESRGHDRCLVAVQVWFPLPVPRLGLVAQDVGQTCEIKQGLFVLFCVRGVLGTVLVTRNNVALGVSKNEAVGDLQCASCVLYFNFSVLLLSWNGEATGTIYLLRQRGTGRISGLSWKVR